MLEDDPKKRPSASKCLRHPWFGEDVDTIKDLLKINKHITSSQ